MANTVSQLFTEKFRPKDFSTLIMPDRIRNELSRGLIQNLLLYGSPGTGKTSALKIITSKYPTLYLNGREDAKVDAIKDKVVKFCSTISLEGGKENLKCVFIDEFDGASAGFFDAIKVPIEKYAHLVRFVACTNYIEKIPDPIKDRFNKISFDAINKEEEDYLITEYKKRLTLILNASKISFTDEILDKFIRNDFPSMRSLLTKTQSFYLRGITELTPANFNINYDYEDLFKLCLNKPDKPYENYKFVVSEYSTRVDEALNVLGNDFVEYLKTNHPQKLDKLPVILIAVAEYQYQRSFVIDPLITLLSCVMKIQIILS